MLTVKQIRGIALVCMIIGMVLAIVSMALPRYASATIAVVDPSNSVEWGVNVGTFHACLEFLPGTPVSITTCGTIDRDCQVELSFYNSEKLPRDLYDDKQIPDYYKDSCNKFNVFRGMLVGATLLVSLAFVVAIIYLFVNPLLRPKVSLGLDVTFCVMAAVAGVLFIIGLVSEDSVISSLPESWQVTDQYQQPSTVTFSAEKAMSFWMCAAACGFALFSLLVWLGGRFGDKSTARLGPEGLPLVDGTQSPVGGSGSYVPPNPAGQQQYFNYGAPPPQPNYQQYGGAPNTNYGFGYQPPAQ